MKTMKINSEYQIREMAGEHVIVRPGRLGVDMTRVISLNDTSLFLWNELHDREFTAEDAAQLLTGNYKVDAATALRDAEAWCRKLVESGLAK